jgi:hypothetical protein
LKKLRCIFLCSLALVAFAALPGIARADDALILNQNLVTPANNALKDALRAEKAARAAKIDAAKAQASADAARAQGSLEATKTEANSDDPKQTAQARPVGEPEATTFDPGLVKGFNYTLDVSSAWPLGNIGHENAAMPGGMDAVLAYGFSRHSRLFTSYYQLQEFPLGFDNGIVPVFLQGLGPPIAHQDLRQQQLDVTTKDKFFITLWQNLFVVGKNLPIPLPIIVSPGYIARTASINAQRNGDTQTIEVNGFPQTVHLRTAQIKLISFTVPLISSPRFFGTITFAPQWNMSICCAQQTNHAQLLQLYYLEYRAAKNTTFFVQPSHVPAYLPPDPYPEHLWSNIYGVAHSFTKNVFVQSTISTGTPTNIKQLGISQLTCLQLPCAPSQIAPTINALKATQVQLIFGIGTPTTIPL